MPLKAILGLIALAFLGGVCATEAIVDNLAPQYEDVLSIRVAGGVGAVIVLGTAVLWVKAKADREQSDR